MKKELIFFILILLYSYTYAQESEEEKVVKVEIIKNNSFEQSDTYGENEFRINFFDLLVVPGLHGYYEKIIDETSSLGAAVYFSLSADPVVDRRFAISPYYRLYFLDRKDYGAKGIFVEVFASIAGADDHESPDTITRFSIGLTTGRKWLTRQGYTFEPFIGFGRYLDGHDDGSDNPGGHLRFGISIGKRF